MEIKTIGGQLTIVLPGPSRPEPKLPPPKIVPGYLADLMTRLESKEELPIPEGEPKSTKYTVSWQAHREAERINDPAILPQIAERLQEAETLHDFWHLSIVLTSIIKNTGSKPAGKLLAQLLQQLPSKTRYLRYVFWGLDNAPTPEVCAFARKHIPHKHWDIEGSALHVLTAGANPKDFTFLSGLLMGNKLHESNLQYCVEATAAAGKKRAVPILKRFIEKHSKNRKQDFKNAVEQAQDALEKESPS